MAEAPSTNQTRFEKAPSPTELPKVDAEILAFWKADGTFQASIDERPEDDQFVFYDGPPFANGLPHYGHLLTGFAKDVIPRYQTMKGKRVERRFGWDTHGLPAELAAEKTLGISGRKAVLDMGIDTFNAAARADGRPPGTLLRSAAAAGPLLMPDSHAAGPLPTRQKRPTCHHRDARRGARR